MPSSSQTSAIVMCRFLLSDFAIRSTPLVGSRSGGGRIRSCRNIWWCVGCRSVAGGADLSALLDACRDRAQQPVLQRRYVRVVWSGHLPGDRGRRAGFVVDGGRLVV